MTALHCFGSAYLRRVLENMRGDEMASVRFGTTGKGIRPNYQIRYGDGEEIPFRGDAHERYELQGWPRDRFYDRNLSAPYRHEDVERELKGRGGG